MNFYWTVAYLMGKWPSKAGFQMTKLDNIKISIKAYENDKQWEKRTYRNQRNMEGCWRVGQKKYHMKGLNDKLLFYTPYKYQKYLPEMAKILCPAVQLTPHLWNMRVEDLQALRKDQFHAFDCVGARVRMCSGSGGHLMARRFVYRIIRECREEINAYAA